MDVKLIAVATDFSAGAKAAFDTALGQARQHGAKLLVVHVIPPLITPQPPAERHDRQPDDHPAAPGPGRLGPA